MIKRIAMWRLYDPSVAPEMKEKLLSLKGNVPSLLDMEVGLNISNSDSAFDIVFIGLFKDIEALREFESDELTP